MTLILGICPDGAKNYDLALFEALQKAPGVKLFGAADYAGLVGNCDLAVVVGVKNNDVIRHLQEIKQNFIYFDKPYNRKWQTTNPEWWRVALNAHNPTDHLNLVQFSDDRARQQGWFARPWRTAGKHILIAGHSAKYSRAYCLPDPNEYVRGLIEDLQKHTNRRIVYRSKPSWPGAEAVEGAELIAKARHQITDDLKGAHAMVTHGSGACLEALLAGIPAIVLGPGISASISSQSCADIENPRLATKAECQQILNNLAYFQYRLDEIRNGKIWQELDSIIADII